MDAHGGGGEWPDPSNRRGGETRQASSEAHGPHGTAGASIRPEWTDGAPPNLEAAPSSLCTSGRNVHDQSFPSPRRLLKPLNPPTHHEQQRRRTSLRRSLVSIQTPNEDPGGEQRAAAHASRKGSEVEINRSAWDQAREEDERGAKEGGDRTLEEVLREAYLESVLHPAGMLQEQLEKEKETASASMAIFQMRSPMLALFSSKAVQLVELLGAVGISIILAMWLQLPEHFEGEASAEYRFTALQFRGGGQGGAGGGVLNIGAFGVLEGGCPVRGGVLSLDSPVKGSVSYPREIEASGWYFVTGQGPATLDPVRWAVERRDFGDSDAAGEGGGGEGEEEGEVRGGWTVMGGTSWTPTVGGVLVETEGVYDTPMERGAEILAKYSCEGSCFLSNIVARGFFIIGFALAFVLSFLFKRCSLAVMVYRITFVATGIVNAVMAEGSFRNRDRFPLFKSYEFLARAVDLLVMGTIFGRSGRFWEMEGVILMLAAFTVVMQIFIERERGVMARTYNFTAVVLYSVSLTLLLFLLSMRVKMLLWGRKLVECDRQMYDGIWAEVLKNENASLLQLSSTAKSVRGWREKPRQIKVQSRNFTNLKRGSEVSRNKSLPESPAFGRSSLSVLPVVANTGQFGAPPVPGTSRNPSFSQGHGMVSSLAVSAKLRATFEGLADSMDGYDGSAPRRSLSRCDPASGRTSPKCDVEHSGRRRHEKSLRVDPFSMMSHVPADGPREREPVRTGWSSQSLWEAFTNQFVKSTNHINCLDQLYAQARGMEPVLRVKARSWAIASKGTFRQAKIKSVERAVEKLLRSYREDVSRLLDVCRQSIVFESVKDLHTCLYHMILDPEVEIVRIKNRLDRKYNSFQSAGYRDVAVNLRIHSQDSMRLGLNGHVVEVLLVLQCFAKAVTPDSHKRYTEFRSVREVVEPTTLKSTIITPLRSSASRLSEFLGASTRTMSVTEASSRHGSAGQYIHVLPINHHRNSMSRPQSADSTWTVQTSDEAQAPAPQTRIHKFSQVANQTSVSAVGVAGAQAPQKETHQGRPSSQFSASGSLSRVLHGLYKTGSLITGRLGSERRSSVVLGTGRKPSVIPGTPHHHNHIEGHSLLPEVYHQGTEEAQEQTSREAAVFETWYLIVTTFPGRYMSDKLRSVSDAIGDTGSAQALFTARPIAAALRFPIFRGFFVLASLILFISVAMVLHGAGQDLGSYPLARVLEEQHIIPKPADVGFYGFRFTALGLRSGKSGNITSPHIAGFEVLQGGCAVLPEPARVVVHGASMEVHYNTSIKLDGVRITTSELGDPEDDPVQWILEAEVSQVGSTPPAAPLWEGVASSNMQWSIFHQVFLESKAKLSIDMFAMPTERDTSIDVSTRVPLTSIVGNAFVPLITGIGLILTVIEAIRGRSNHCAKILSVVCLVCGCVRCFQGIYMIQNPLHTFTSEGIHEVFAGAVILTFSVQLCFFEWLFMVWLPMTAISLSIFEVIKRNVLQEHELCLWEIGCGLPFTAFSLLAATMFMYCWSFVNKAFSKSMIANDINEYSLRWIGLVETCKDEIDKLCSLVSDLDSLLHKDAARQFNRKRDEPLTALPSCDLQGLEVGNSSEESTDAGRNGSESTVSTLRDAAEDFKRAMRRSWDDMSHSTEDLPGGAETRTKSVSRKKRNKSRKNKSKQDQDGPVDTSSRVTSLDQLNAQAMGLDPILRIKVQGWAMASRGHFRCVDTESGEPEFVLWETALASEELKARIKWARLKKLGRTVEKLMRSYREDVSRLLDVCRQSIVFDTVADVTTCLQAIMNDPDVEIVRIKNRLDPNYNAAQSAGYRDLAMNLRICNEDTAKLGVDVHVCEVQLLVRTFAEIKNDSGHKRYIEFRNRRGE